MPDTFCEISSQKVNVGKSRVFFSPNLDHNCRQELCNILEFHSTPSLGKYLGFPLKHTLSPQDFGAVIERVQGKLAGWKAHLLSFVGWLVLTQATLSTIPNYQCNVLPFHQRLPKVLIDCVITSFGVQWITKRSSI